MTKDKQYSLSEFYLCLKLDIWTSGNVEGWGFVQTVDVYSDKSTNKGCFVKKLPAAYKIENSITTKQLNTGLYLLDMYPLDTQEKEKPKYKIYNYLVVISECRLKGAFEERICYLKVTNYKFLPAFKDTVYKSNPAVAYIGKTTSFFRKKPTARRFNNSPIHAANRKH